MKIEIDLKKETMVKLTEIAQYETLQRKIRGEDEIVSEEDVIKGAIFECLEKIYNYNKVTVNHELGRPYKLKNRFESVMKYQGVTAKDMSEATGIHQGNISKFVNNKNQPSLDYFLRMWIYLKCPDVFNVLYREK